MHSFFDSVESHILIQKDIEGAVAPFDDFILVGKGVVKGCGDLMPLLSCQSCMAPAFVKRTCNMKRCPNCWEKWASEYSTKIATILTGAKEAKVFWKYPIKHMILSPDRSLYHLSVDDLRNEAIRYVKKMGKGRDCAFFFHAHRPNQRFWDEYGTREGKEESQKKWDWIRSKDNWQDYVEYSPHFHFLGFVWMQKPIAGDEWIYKVVQIVKEKDKKLLYKLQRIASYLLSHTVDRKSQTNFMPVTWNGRLSIRSRGDHKIELWEEYKKRVHQLKEERKKSVHCRDCGGGLWFMSENMKAFFNSWFGVKWTNAHSISENQSLMSRLYCNMHLKIVQNVVINIWLLCGDPPYRVENHQIVDYNRFIASQE